MRFSAKKLALMAVLTAAALIVFIIEAQIPVPVPIPGVKLGLANVITLFALFWRRQEASMASALRKEKNAASEQHKEVRISLTLRKEKSAADGLTTADAFMILVCRIVLGAVFSGNAAALIYSTAGGMFAFAAEAALKRFVTDKQIWVCGVSGAIFHNIGQILAAMLVTGTPYIAALLPVLTIVAVITGVITGMAAQFAVARLSGGGNS